MKKSIASLVLVLLLVASCTSRVMAAPAASAQQFVQSFYNWYVTKSSNGGDVRGMEVAIKLKKQLFDTTLYKAIAADAAAAAKSPGELVGIDFDPFVAANGLIYEKYSAAAAVAKGSTSRVPVYGVESNGKRTAKPLLEAEVAARDEHYVFTNFHYKNTGTPENANLLNVLATLRKERANTTK